MQVTGQRSHLGAGHWSEVTRCCRSLVSGHTLVQVTGEWSHVGASHRSEVTRWCRSLTAVWDYWERNKNTWVTDTSPVLRRCVKKRGGRPGLPIPNKPYGSCGRKATLNDSMPELKSCAKNEVDVLGYPSLISLMVSVDIKQH